jgi:hypothetical protein
MHNCDDETGELGLATVSGRPKKAVGPLVTAKCPEKKRECEKLKSNYR